MPRPAPKITFAEFLSRMNEDQKKRFQIIGPFNGIMSPLKIKCTECDHEWETIATRVLKYQTGCKKCFIKKQTMTHEQYLEKYGPAIAEKNIEVIGKYVDSQTKIRLRCKIDGYRWEANPLKVAGCMVCYQERRRGPRGPKRKREE